MPSQRRKLQSQYASSTQQPHSASTLLWELYDAVANSEELLLLHIPVHQALRCTRNLDLLSFLGSREEAAKVRLYYAAYLSEGSFRAIIPYHNTKYDSVSRS